MSFDAPELPAGFLNVGLAADTVIAAGELVAVNASGYAVPAADTAGLTVIGRAESDVDNTDGSAGDLDVTVKRGVFKYDNSSGNPVTIASIGAACYVEDSTTVAVAAGPDNDIPAGLVIRVESDGVYIDTALAPLL